eukprot:3613105-Rhodomonas_salina.3
MTADAKPLRERCRLGRTAVAEQAGNARNVSLCSANEALNEEDTARILRTAQLRIHTALP